MPSGVSKATRPETAYCRAGAVGVNEASYGTVTLSPGAIESTSAASDVPCPRPSPALDDSRATVASYAVVAPTFLTVASRVP